MTPADSESGVFPDEEKQIVPEPKELPVIPLELQEMIITLGPRTNPTRFAFLCTCALVCKSWVSISRSGLAMDVWFELEDWYPMDALLSSPYSTLGHAIRTIRVGWHDESWMMHECMGLLPMVVQQLPSVSELCIVSEMVPSLTSSKGACMSNIRTLEIVFRNTISLHPVHTIHNILTVCFPNVESLRLNAGKIWAYMPSPFELDLPPPQAMLLPFLRTLDISIHEPENIDHLGHVIIASPSLQHLTLRLTSPESILATSSWLQNPSRSCLLTGVSLCVEMLPWGIKITDPGLDFFLCRAQCLMAPYYMDPLSLSTALIPWIHQTPHLECLAFLSPLSAVEPEIEGMDWEPFVTALEHAPHFEQLIVVMSHVREEPVEPGYISLLKRVVPPHVSVCLWTRLEWDSKDYVTSCIDRLHYTRPPDLRLGFELKAAHCHWLPVRVTE